MLVQCFCLELWTIKVGLLVSPIQIVLLYLDTTPTLWSYQSHSMLLFMCNYRWIWKLQMWFSVGFGSIGHISNESYSFRAWFHLVDRVSIIFLTDRCYSLSLAWVGTSVRLLMIYKTWPDYTGAIFIYSLHQSHIYLALVYATLLY